MMVAHTMRTSAPVAWWRACRYRFQCAVDRLSVVVCGRHAVSPAQIGDGHHDCALSSLYWAVPVISETAIIDAFNVATDTWPYGGVTNKEFAIALRHLRVNNLYSTNTNTLGTLLAAKPVKCVALLHGHFIPIVDGLIVGRDAYRRWPADTYVYCHWTFT